MNPQGRYKGLQPGESRWENPPLQKQELGAGETKGKFGPSVKGSVKVTFRVPVITRALGVKGDSRTTPGSKPAEGQTRTRELFEEPEQAD